MAGLLASGDLYFSILNADGSNQGFVPFGNATQFEIQVPTDKKERMGKSRKNYRSTLDTVYIKKPATLKIVADDLDVDNLALAFLGSRTSELVVGGSIVAESVVAFDLSKQISLSKDAVSNVVVKDSTGTITYVENTDYTVTSELGFINILSTGAIVALDVLLIDYDYKQVSQSIIQGGTENSILVHLRLIGENLVDNSKIVVDVWRANLAPSASIDFLSDDFATLPLEGSLELVEGKDSTFQVRTNVVHT